SADNCSDSDMAPLSNKKGEPSRTVPSKRKYGATTPSHKLRSLIESSIWMTLTLSPVWNVNGFFSKGGARGACSLEQNAHSSFDEPHTHPSGQVLHVLPGHAAGAGAARGRPLECFALELFPPQGNPVMADIAGHHCEVFVLAAAMEPEPESKAIGQRHFLLDRLARIDRGRGLVLHHVARHQVAPVRGGIEHDVVRPAFDAALKYRLERLVARVLGLEREVVAEQDETIGRHAHQRHQIGQAL